MSLIFSALSEMEKQAQDGQPVRAPMAGMQSFSPERRQWPVLVGTLAVLGLLAFVAVKALQPTPSTAVATPVNAVPVQVAATIPAVKTTPVPQAGETTPALAPYMQAAPVQESIPAASNALIAADTSSVYNEPAATVAAVPAPVSVTRNALSAPDSATEQNDASTATSVAANDTDTDSASASAEQAPVAPPKPRAAPDKSYLDKTTFKLGRQPDNNKDQDVSHWVNLFSSEMSAGNFTQAHVYLEKLQSKLPAQSLTSLRMQAWYSVETADDASARDLYTRILDRVPDDQNAGVNIALIDWRANRYTAALARIDRLHQMYPDSSLVSQNWRSMHDQQQ